MRRAAPAFEILMFAPVRRFFPEPRQRLNGGWRRARVCTPPRISPSCPHYVPLWLGRSTIVRGQDHCEAACQSCFWMDGYRSSPSWAVFIQKICTGGLRASSASLFHFWLIRLMSFSRWICTFQAAREHVLKIPLTPYPYSSPCCTKLFSRFQKFQQFLQNSILFVVQCHERNAEFFGCFPFAAVFEEKHINELTIIL